ncbi:flavin monoamine oxidase family protein [Nocardia sp. NPDC049149]|uniref:flavin monoamine oxidase family protein n=1 Tax=Nocardia sp. NPDC049149 TaxID=3364315 RepID=UPI0037217D5B
MTAVTREADVVVVGAGLAGLSAARRLRDNGARVVIAEARDRVGGRTLNHPIGDGHVVEVGGQWVGPGQDRILAVIEELGLGIYPTHNAGRHLFEHRGRLHRFRGRFPLIPAPGLGEGFVALKRLDRMARTVPAAAPWQAARAGEWDGQTVETWMRRGVFSAAGRAVITIVCEMVWAADPAEVSLLHLLAYIHAAGGIDRLIDTDGGAQESRVVGGSQRIAVAMAARMPREDLLLATPIRRIAQTASSVIVHGDTVAVRARRVIVAMNPALSGRLTYSPQLPTDRDLLTQRTPNGSVIKCMAVYEAPFWRDNGLSGQVIATAGPVKAVFDNSPAEGGPGVLLAFLEARTARALASGTEADRRAEVLAAFVRFFGAQAQRPRTYLEKDWAAEEWSRGCYGAFFPPNTWTAYGRALRMPVGRVHWAGAETATVWMGYMDGAIRSGERAADEILTALSDEPR